MTIFFVFYSVLLLLVLVYVAVNVYHLIRFRLDIPGDKSPLALAIYLLLIVSILVVSIMMATIAYQL